MKPTLDNLMFFFLGVWLLTGIESINATQFVGLTNSKAIFVYEHHEPLFHRLDYCAMTGLYPGTVESLWEGEMVTNFAINNNKGIWLPAMDYGHEGTFTWLKNGGNATAYFEWDQTYPVNNRSANCLAIGPNGKLRSVSCLGENDLGPLNFLLCESMLVWPISEPKEESINVQTRPKSLDDDVLKPKGLEVIGIAGGKLYYHNNQSLVSFGTALEDCHAFGMNLATPETAEEQDLLFTYAKRLAEAGDNQPLLWTSGTNIATPNCFSTSSQLRWLTTLRDIENPNAPPTVGRHACLVVNPSSALSITSCCEGCMAAHTVCEMAI